MFDKFEVTIYQLNREENTGAITLEIRQGNEAFETCDMLNYAVPSLHTYGRWLTTDIEQAITEVFDLIRNCEIEDDEAFVILEQLFKEKSK